MWIIDSSVYIDWMRQGRSPTRILRPFVLADQVFTCGVIRVEVLRGAVKPAVRTELGELFNALRDIPFTAGVWDRTEALAWQLDRAGTVLPLSDLMIAGCALHVGATVVTTDPHYGQVPGLTVRGTLPTVSFG